MKMHSYFAVISLAASVSVVQASPFAFQINQGGKAQITFTYNGGGTAQANFMDNGPGDEDPRPGIFLFTPPGQKDLQSVDIKNLGALGPFVPAAVHLDFGAQGPDAFVPNHFPVIGTIDPNRILVTSINVPTFVASAASFSLGNAVQVTNGAIGAIPGLSILDGTSLYPTASAFFDVNVPLTPSVLASLTSYSGGAQVVSSVDIVPEPATSSLFILAIALLLACCRYQLLRHT